MQAVTKLAAADAVGVDISERCYEGVGLSMAKSAASVTTLQAKEVGTSATFHQESEWSRSLSRGYAKHNP